MPRKTILIILAFFAIYVIWGSTYLLNKIVVTEVSPLYLASLRFTVASILIFIIAKALKLNLAITPKQLKNNIFAGFLFLVYGNGVFVGVASTGTGNRVMTTPMESLRLPTINGCQSPTELSYLSLLALLIKVRPERVLGEFC